MQNKLAYTDLINAADQRVKPTMAAFQAAAGNADFSKAQDFRLILTNQPGAASWPITAATFMLMRRDAAPDRNKEVLKFLDWALHDGQADSLKLDYVPFPDSVVKQIEAAWTNDLKAWP
jgi:phosphate transport system substrate-binding protein